MTAPVSSVCRLEGNDHPKCSDGLGNSWRNPHRDCAGCHALAQRSNRWRRELAVERIEVQRLERLIASARDLFPALAAVADRFDVDPPTEIEGQMSLLNNNKETTS